MNNTPESPKKSEEDVLPYGQVQSRAVNVIWYATTLPTRDIGNAVEALEKTTKVSSALEERVSTLQSPVCR